MTENYNFNNKKMKVSEERQSEEKKRMEEVDEISLKGKTVGPKGSAALKCNPACFQAPQSSLVFGQSMSGKTYFAMHL